MKSALAALAFLFLSGVCALAGAVRPVVVEVYTSQGCNSCLFANTMAAKIAQKPGVLLLSFGVTYWDMFGWKDTLANEDNTKRQRAYAAALHRGGVYTPQMIIDGVSDVPASRVDAVSAAIDMAALKRDQTTAAPATADTTLSVPVTLKRAEDGLNVIIARAPDRHGVDATVWLLRVRSSATVKITAGESAGQTVTYRNVVTGIQNLGAWRGAAQTIAVPKPTGKVIAHDGVAVLVQQGGYGRIVGAVFQQGSAY